LALPGRVGRYCGAREMKTPYFLTMLGGMAKGDPQYVTALEIPPVDSAETAVKIAIAAQGKQ